MKNTIIEIRSNGSKWAGEQPDSIEMLLNVLESYTLDPCFEDFGNFATEFKPTKGWNEKNEQYKGCTSFFGNFSTLSHVFNIITNDNELIQKLTEVIRANQQTEAYKEARAEYIATNKVKEYSQNKFYNKELSLQEMYKFPITDEGKALYEHYKNELIAAV